MKSEQHKNVSILIADDHELVRTGLKALVEKESGFSVLGEASDGIEAVERVREYEPDVVIMDISMPKQSGIEAIEEILRLESPPKIIALSMHIEPEIVSDALHAGASGYLVKACRQSDLIEAIYMVLKGFTYLSPQVTGAIVQSYTTKTDSSHHSGANLSEREIEVLQHLVQGFSIRVIAEKLGISPKTVESHKANIMAKLDVSNLVEMIKYALKKNLIEVNDWLADS